MLVSITARVALAGIVAMAVAFAVAERATPRTLAAGDCTVDATMDTEEQAFLVLINNYRAQNNLPPLAASYTLTKASAWKSRDLGTNNYFAHDDLSRTWVQRIRDCGYGFNTSLGENIAAGYTTAQQVFDGWKSSPGHNANMLGATHTGVGIGRAYVAGSTYGWYWTTDFGGFSDGWATVTATFTSTPTLTPTPTAIPATATTIATNSPTRTPTPTCNIMRADVNSDGRVTLADLIILAADYGQPVPPAPASYDQNGDAKITLADLILQGQVYGQDVTACP